MGDKFLPFFFILPPVGGLFTGYHCKDVAKIFNRWDCVDSRLVPWVTLKRKVKQTCLSTRKVKPTDGYFTRLLAIVYIPATAPSTIPGSLGSIMLLLLNVN